VSDDASRARYAGLAGLVGGPLLEAAIERRLDVCESFEEAGALYLEAVCAGGPRSAIGRVAGRLCMSEPDRPVTLAPDEYAETVTLALRGDDMLRTRAATNLAQFGDRAEACVSLLLASDRPDVSKAAAQVASQLGHASDAFVAEVARLLNGQVRRVAELEHLALLARCPSIPVRVKLAETAGLPDNDYAEVKPHLLALAGDGTEEVATAALSALAAHAGDEPWVRRLVLERSRTDRWLTQRHAVDVMAVRPAWEYLPRLLELLPQNDDITDRAVKALDAVARRHPERGLVVLDIREPRKVNERYGMEASFDWNADNRAEALRLLILALDRRKDDAQVKRAHGKKLMLSRVTGAEDPAHSLVGSIAPTEFESLALHLKVSFADEESGSIVAEVADQPTGEVLNALLQTDSVVVTSVAWS
jgi:hypothetical protein